MKDNFQSKYAENSAGSIGFSYIKAYNIWHRKIKSELLNIGITHPQFVVLASLGYLKQHQNEVKQIDVANSADIDVMTISTIIRNLEKLELVHRTTSELDTRAKVLSITTEGTQILNRALKIVEAIDTQFFSILKDDEKTFNHLLHTLIQDNS